MDTDISKKLEDNLFEGFRLLRGLENVQWYCESSSEFFISGCQAPWLNGVLYCNSPSSSMESFVRQTSEHFKSEQVAAVWRIGNSTNERQALSEMLQDFGFEKIANSPEMVLDLSTLQTPRECLLEFTPLTVNHIDDWLQPFILSFELCAEDRCFFKAFLSKTLQDPSCTFKSYIGSFEGKPVCCGSLSCFGEIPVIYNVATHPEHRGKGFGTAITQHLASEASMNGFDKVGLFATEAGFPIYRNLGFTVISEMEGYLLSL